MRKYLKSDLIRVFSNYKIYIAIIIVAFILNMGIEDRRADIKSVLGAFQVIVISKYMIVVYTVCAAVYAGALVDELNSMYARGSSLNMWYDITLEQCKQAKENGGKVAVFFISDGENTSGETIKSFKELSKYIDAGAVLGYGTSKGGIMEVDDWENGQPETVKDPEDFVTDAVSKIDESNLKQIARDLDVSYVNMNTKDGLDQVVKNVLKDAKRTNTDKKAAGYKDIYFVFVIPFLLLLIFEYRYSFMAKTRH